MPIVSHIIKVLSIALVCTQKGNNDYNDLHVALLVFEFQWLIWCYNIWYHMQKTPILNVEVLFENTGII